MRRSRSASMSRRVAASNCLIRLVTSRRDAITHSDQTERLKEWILTGPQCVVMTMAANLASAGRLKRCQV